MGVAGGLQSLAAHEWHHAAAVAAADGASWVRGVEAEALVGFARRCHTPQGGSV